MSKFLKKRAKKVGLPPGSLVTIGDKSSESVHFSLIDYDENKFVEKQHATLNECLVALNHPSITWINVCGVDSQTIDTLGRHFGLHPLLLEDIITTGQRSKLDNYKDTMYLVAKMLTYNEEKQETADEQVSIVLGKNFLISFLESPTDIFGPIRERIRQSINRMRQRGPDYLCYALIDSLVDHYFLILEKVDDKMAQLEVELMQDPASDTLFKIQRAKREIASLRKSVWPMREVISNFRRIESPLVQDATKLYLHDVYDHTIQAIDTIESFRDITSGMLDIYLSNISQRMNEIMKVLTIVATIFVPLTFIASLYGMNFEGIPELHWKYSYPVVLSVMVVIALSMVYYFKRKGWL